MQRCKYLDDLGIPVNEYGTNFVSDDDPREQNWSEEREKYGFDNRETWNLDRNFIEWIYTRVIMYKEYSIVDTSFYKVPYKDEKITQGEAIDKILELAKEILQANAYNFDKDINDMIYNNSREICDLWKEILPLMWW